jgi:hypothetical protein
MEQKNLSNERPLGQSVISFSVESDAGVMLTVIPISTSVERETSRAQPK